MLNTSICRVSNVLDTRLKGWLPVIDRDKNKFQILYSTKIEFIKKTNIFLIKEGQFKDAMAEIDFKNISPRLFKNYFTDTFKIKDNCELFLSLKDQILFYKLNEKSFVEIYVHALELEPGIYKILLPKTKFKGQKTTRYIEEDMGGSRFAETWFPIIKDKFEERYLHFGTYSLGCITIVAGQTSKWNELFIFLLQSRMKGDYLGKIYITDKSFMT